MKKKEMKLFFRNNVDDDDVALLKCSAFFWLEGMLIGEILWGMFAVVFKFYLFFLWTISWNSCFI
jgi:hypothetical protein